MATPRYKTDVAMAAIEAAKQRLGVHPWVTRSAARHEHDGQQWAVVVDWAVRPDGSAVPAAVTLTSVGGSLGDPVPEGVEPLAVTRALIDSVAWSTVLWGSRTGAAKHAEHTGKPSEPYKKRQALGDHDDRLRLVADLYLQAGGVANPTVALDVLVRLELQGQAPGGQPHSQRATVRRWIKEARQRGYLPPAAQ